MTSTLATTSTADAIAQAQIRLLLDVPRDGDVESLADALRQQCPRFLDSCSRSRVLVRCLQKLQAQGVALPEQAQQRLEAEQQRVAAAMQHLARITALFAELREPFTTIKTLDQYPDQGHDVDVLTGPENPHVLQALAERLQAKLGERSLSEVLAAKRNFRFAGDVTLEVHGGRLGQVGEHDRLAMDILASRCRVSVGGVQTFAPSVESRLLLAMLQRIYRHFNFRVCDVVNLGQMLRDEQMNWDAAWRMARVGGVTQGVAVGLRSVHGLLDRLGVACPAAPLPSMAGTVRAVELTFRREYYRFGLWAVVPGAYARQFVQFARRGRLAKVGRLSLLAALMAFVGLNICLAPSAPLWRRLW